ncbi:MAG TPA: cytochrome d ubiquinol oxidase subunit II [Solirubrobacteraceae bacterium]|nr:cytochrome d ubiquinol oxidase subunit II [Solirubrobacteraceae bacterium]
MHLYDIPLLFVLIGLTLYVVLGGADFGAGFWQLLAGPRGDRVRDHAHDSIAPVWEANHVWLIFVLTVTWTAYPRAFGAIASTLCVPLFIAAIGIVMRGATYALRAGARSERERRVIDLIFALSSVIAPFAFGTAVGAIATLRVPNRVGVGGALSSWTSSSSLIVGALAVATSAYLAAVFMAADAQRIERGHEEDSLIAGLRVRALAAGVVAGAVALAGLVVIHSDAHFLYTRLLHGAALGAVIGSAVAGLVTLALVATRRFEPARYTAALAVAAVVAGWALAQRPLLLRGLTVQQAAAPHDTLVLVVISVVAGAVLLFPSLSLLFRLVLAGRLDHGEADADDQGVALTRDRGLRPQLGRLLAVSRPGLLARLAGACLLAGFGLLTLAEAGWAHAIGIVALLGFIGFGFAAIVPAELDEFERAEQARAEGAEP